MTDQFRLNDYTVSIEMRSKFKSI